MLGHVAAFKPWVDEEKKDFGVMFIVKFLLHFFFFFGRFLANSLTKDERKEFFFIIYF